MSALISTHTIRGTERLTRALKPHTRKHRVSVWILDPGALVSCSGTYWDGGTRSAYQHLRADGSTRAIPCPGSPPQFGGGDAPEVEPDQGGAILRTGTFCGRTSAPTIYLTADTARQFGVAP